MNRMLIRLIAETFAALALLTVLAATGAVAGPLDRAMAAVLVLRSADGQDRFLGSGFVWDGGGVAVTAAHVVGDASEVRVLAADGRTATVPVRAADPLRDVAILDLTGDWGPGLSPGPVPDLGGPVFALGAPLGAGFSLSRGVVSAQARQVDPAVPLMFLQHDAAVNPGSSGGPLVDAAGRAVGMNLRIADGSRHFVGIGYAIAAADLSAIVAEMLAGRLRPLPKLGLTLRPVTPRIAAALGLAGTGLLVDHADPGLAAALAGVRAGDVLLRAGERPLDTPGALAFAVAEAGAEVELGLIRGGTSLTLRLELAAAAPTVPVGVGHPRPPPTLAALGIGLDGTEVAAVADGALAYGLAPGDRVLALDGAAADPGELAGRRLAAAAVLLVRAPGGRTRHVVIDPAAPPRGPVGGANVLDPDVVLF
jgi:serine protease Do